MRCEKSILKELQHLPSQMSFIAAIVEIGTRKFTTLA
jgi:hypothetical protein